MGLDMYLYRTTKGRFASRKKYYEEMNKHYKKWDPILRQIPVKVGGWEFDESKMTKEHKDNVAKEKEERDAIAVSTNYSPDSRNDREDHYWRKFNALHGFIVRTFADGEDTCQTIEIKDANGSYKNGVKKILDALEKTQHQLDKGKKTNLAMMPQEGFFFGSTDVDDWFKNDVKESLEYFRDLYNSMNDKDVIFYEASW